MSKRSSEDADGVEKIRKKLKKLEKKLEKITNTKDTERDAPVTDEDTMQNEPILIDPEDPLLDDSVENPELSESLNPLLLEDPILDESIINLLGEEGEEKENTTTLHSEIKKRWQIILKDGLSKEVRETLMKKYQTPKNCTELTPPLLNDIVKEVLNEAGLNRDKRIAEKQKKLGLAITAIGTALSKLLDCNSHGNKDTIEVLSDSCRLLCDIFHSDSITRRALIVPGLNKDIKELINNAQITEYLFGNDLQEKVKACKATKNSAKELKIPPPVKPSIAKGKVALNSRGPLRSTIQVQPRPSGPPFQAAAQARRAPQRLPPRNYHRNNQQKRRHY